MKTVENILTLFDERGHSQYGGENVTQLEHALQTAELAEQAGASSALIVAALLHDIGHLLHELPDDAPDQGMDDCHESSGCSFLRTCFPAAVVEPVRLHVDAKRYLCAIDSAYFDQLSEPSIVSLSLQGGPMSSKEIVAFEVNAHCQSAIQLRRWDDTAKVPGKSTPSLRYFEKYLQDIAS